MYRRGRVHEVSFFISAAPGCKGSKTRYGARHPQADAVGSGTTLAPQTSRETFCAPTLFELSSNTKVNGLQEELMHRLEKEFDACAKRYGLSRGDFPKVRFLC